MFPTQWDKTNLNRHSDDKIAPRAVKNVLRGSKAHRGGIQEAMPYVAIPVNNFYSSVFYFSQVWHGDFLWGLNFYEFIVCCRVSQVVESQELKSVTLKNSSKFVHGWSETVSSKYKHKYNNYFQRSKYR